MPPGAALEPALEGQPFRPELHPPADQNGLHPPLSVELSQPFLQRLQREITRLRQNWYALVALSCLLGLGVFSTLISIPLGMVAHALVGLGAGALPVALIAFTASRSYQQQYTTVLRDMLQGPMLLMLLDESFGRALEEQRRERYRPVLDQVQVGEGLMQRIEHFALYYTQYYRAGYGRVEQPVPGVSQLTCMREGLLASLAACGSVCLIGLPFFMLSLIRILVVWPRLLAVHQVVLEILAGQHDAAFEASDQTGADPSTDPQPPQPEFPPA